MTEKPIMTVAEVAAFFEVSNYTIREWLKAGKLQGTKPGKSWRIKRTDVHALAQLEYGDLND